MNRDFGRAVLLSILAIILAGLVVGLSIEVANGHEHEEQYTILKFRATDDEGPLADVWFEIVGPGFPEGSNFYGPSDENGEVCIPGYEGLNDGLEWTVTAHPPAGYVSTNQNPQTTNGDDDKYASCDREGESPDLKFTFEGGAVVVPPPVTPPSAPVPTPTATPAVPVAPDLPPTLPDTATRP